MKHLFDNLERLEAAAAGRHLLLLLDFDGTLAPIAATPEAAQMPEETGAVLDRLSRDPGCSIAIVSGRALGDVAEKVGIPGITYVGNHGLEIERPGEERETFVPARFPTLIRRVGADLDAALAPVQGASVEDKGCSLAVHYRLVREADRPLVRAAVSKVVRAHGAEREIGIHGGKMVMELRPAVDWDKGTIEVSMLIEDQQGRCGGRGLFAVYIGDDATDEPAFRAVAGRGIGILVGPPGDSSAEYCVSDPGAVRVLLEILSTRLTPGSCG